MFTIDEMRSHKQGGGVNDRNPTTDDSAIYDPRAADASGGTDSRQRTTRIDRAALFDEVWSIPISRLATRYGISDVGLAKICRRLRIPRPGRGHWAKPESRRPKRPPLPRSPGPEFVSIDPLANTKPPDPHEEPPIEVPERLTRPHPLVREIRDQLHSARYRYEVDGVPVRVAQSSQSRALRILDGLVKALDERGWKVSRDRQHLSVHVGDEDIQFFLREKQQQAADRSSRWDRREAKWTGRLELQLVGFYANGIRQCWRDGKRRTLEAALGSFVAGLEIAADLRRRERIERENWHRQWEERRLRELEEQRRREAEARRVEDLLDKVERRKTAVAIREFVLALEQSSSELTDSTAEWIAWARRHADRIDPLLDAHTAGPRRPPSPGSPWSLGA